MRFGHGRKTKNDENCISATAETEKTPQNSISTPWKWEKCLKTVFQPLGNGRNALKQFSNPLDMKKMPQNGFPTPWKWKKCLKTAFQPLGSRKIDVETEFT